MLRWLTILGLSIGMVNAAWSQVRRDWDHQNQKFQQAQSQTNTPQPTLSPSIEAQQSSRAQKQDANAESSSYRWKDLLSPANLPNWCLVIVGIWAGGMAYWTLRNIEKQTDQLKVQASMMKAQMDMMVHKERARLNIELQPLQLVNNEGGYDYLITYIELTNIGQSKAYITFSAGRFAVVPNIQGGLPPADPDDFSPTSNVVEASGQPVRESFIIDEFCPLDFQEFAGKLANGDLTAYLYGFVEYDTLGIKYRRDFGYMWPIDESLRNSGLHSSEKLLAAGSWEPSLTLPNVEREIRAN